MTARRAKGDGGLHWDAKRERWIATVTLGYDGRGKRVVKKGSGRTKTEAKRKLREVLRDHQDGMALGDDAYTVKQAVEDWLAHGLGIATQRPGRRIAACAPTTWCRCWARGGFGI